MNGKEMSKEELNEKIQELKNQWWEEAKAILETDYPRKRTQLDGKADKELAKLQVKYRQLFRELLS